MKTSGKTHNHLYDKNTFLHTQKFANSKMLSIFALVKEICTIQVLKDAEIAQLVEHNLAKVGVAGPSPVFRSDERSDNQKVITSFVLYSIGLSGEARTILTSIHAPQKLF